MTDIEIYNSKLTNCDELAMSIQSGWLLGTDAGTSQPDGILNALCSRAARTDDLKGVKVQMLLDVYPYAFLADDSLNGKVNCVSWFAGAGARKAINAGYADYIPNYYRDTPKLIRENYEYDAFCVSVSPMDKHGYFSLSCTSSYSEAMLAKAKRIFVEVNSFQPRAVGNTQIHVSQVDAIVENSHELPVSATRSRTF